MKITCLEGNNNQEPIKISVPESGFICLSNEGHKFSTNALDLNTKDNKIRIQPKQTLVALQTLCHNSNCLYSKVLKDIPMLFRTFNGDFEPISTKDQMIINNSLFIVKFTSINGSFKLNHVSSKGKRPCRGERTFFHTGELCIPKG